ncbi:CMD domain protein [Rhizobium sp. PP-CC-3G-465]|uniref:CMD domain protein n=1 Tax=Rhizobium sp. PP-CC-3G-465 TaxID=2135648 RepID=UPI0010533F62|nr:CMD domain protein [Rhizobium sp. PP-CC-3G-465]
MTDIIDTLAGTATGSPLEALRLRRPVTRDNAEKTYRALFQPVNVDDVSLAERFAVALFVAVLHADTASTEHYGALLTGQPDGERLLATVLAAAEAGVTKGPYGAYPDGPLSVENKAGLQYAVASAQRDAIGARLAAALDHAHLLVFRPREASPEALAALAAAGWSSTGIVTLSQLVAFLSFQIRVVAGLKVLSAA